MEVGVGWGGERLRLPTPQGSVLGGPMALQLMPISFYPDTSPRGFQPGADAARKLGGRGVGRVGHEEGPWAWSLGREPSWKILWPLSPGKTPYPSQLLQAGKGPPHGESQVEGAKEVHLFSGRERRERGPLRREKETLQTGGHPPSTHRREMKTYSWSGRDSQELGCYHLKKKKTHH